MGHESAPQRVNRSSEDIPATINNQRDWVTRFSRVVRRDDRVRKVVSAAVSATLSLATPSLATLSLATLRDPPDTMQQCCFIHASFFHHTGGLGDRLWNFVVASQVTKMLDFGFQSFDGT